MAARPSPRPAADAPAADLVEAVHGVMHAVRARQQHELRAAGTDMTPLEGRVIGYFAAHPGATLRDLAEHAGRDKGQLTRLVQGLRERGLLQARPHEDDRRQTRFDLTEPARRLHQAWLAQRRRIARVAAAGLDAQERQTLLALLARLRRNLEAA